MNSGAFGSIVREMSLAVAHEATHAGNDNDGRGARGELVPNGGLEERKEGNGAEIDTCHVGLVNVTPFFDGLAFPDLVMKLWSGGGFGRSLGSGDTGVGD